MASLSALGSLRVPVVGTVMASGDKAREGKRVVPQVQPGPATEHRPSTGFPFAESVRP